MRTCITKAKKRTRICPLFGTKKEDGSMLLEELGAILVMVFIFLTLVAYACYAKAVQTRLLVDNIAKEYLYIMEAEGCLTSSKQNEMRTELESLGMRSVSFTGTDYTTSQAPYGTQMKLVCSMEFDNPLNHFFDTSNPFFTAAGVDSTVTYKLEMTATSKW